MSEPLPSPPTLRVLTLNIWNNQGPWPTRLAMIRQGITALDPHLIGLQEVLHLDGPDDASSVNPTPPTPPIPRIMDQAQTIADGLGYYTAFASAWHIGGGLQFGNALLSRYPIVVARTFHLPTDPDDETRGLLYCVVDAPCGKIPVFVTHLSWKLHQSDVRQQQVSFIAQRVRELAPVSDGVDGFPPLLMGDFNAEPDSDEIRFLRGYHARFGRSVYFADAFAVAGDGSAGYTFARNNPFALRAREPNRRLDYIFSRGPDRLLRGEPLSARVVFDTAQDGVFASDHYGVFAEIQALPRKLDPL
jgi:endonuclease/exonuclease/phosphatase family metal-dependent hydrolase